MAREKGLDEEAVGAVVLNVMMVAAGATRNKAQEVYDTRVNPE